MGTTGHNNFLAFNHKRPRKLTYLGSWLRTVWERNHEKVKEAAKTKELDRDLLANQALLRCRPTECGQNEKAPNQTECKGARWKSHKRVHFETNKHLGKLLIRVSE